MGDLEHLTVLVHLHALRCESQASRSSLHFVPVGDRYVHPFIVLVIFVQEAPTEHGLPDNVGDNQVAVSDIDVNLVGLGDSAFIALFSPLLRPLGTCR